jgi:hypothetical protein
LSALVEDFDGNWNLLYYNEHLAVQKTKPEKKPGAVIENFPASDKQVAFKGIFLGQNQRII